MSTTATTHTVGLEAFIRKQERERMREALANHLSRIRAQLQEIVDERRGVAWA